MADVSINWCNSNLTYRQLTTLPVCKISDHLSFVSSNLLNADTRSMVQLSVVDVRTKKRMWLCSFFSTFQVIPEGVAARTMRLRIGDRILRVNGKDVSRATHQEAVQALLEPTSELILVRYVFSFLRLHSLISGTVVEHIFVYLYIPSMNSKGVTVGLTLRTERGFYVNQRNWSIQSNLIL